MWAVSSGSGRPSGSSACARRRTTAARPAAIRSCSSRGAPSCATRTSFHVSGAARTASKDPALIAKATPAYTVGCKRILPSNAWYPALARENVELVTSTIAEVKPHSVVLASGRELEVDALIFGTGFDVIDMPVGRMVHGRDGRTLADAWNGSPRAHLGSTVPGFPNLFLMLGPNTGLGHSSMIYMIESQIA